MRERLHILFAVAGFVVLGALILGAAPAAADRLDERICTPAEGGATGEFCVERHHSFNVTETPGRYIVTGNGWSLATSAVTTPEGISCESEDFLEFHETSITDINTGELLVYSSRQHSTHFHRCVYPEGQVTGERCEAESNVHVVNGTTIRDESSNICTPIS